MSKTREDIEVTAGDTWLRRVPVLMNGEKPEGGIAGWAVTMTVKARRSDDEVIARRIVTDHYDDAEAITALFLTSDETRAVADARYGGAHYDVQVETPAGDVQTVREGRITARGDVTQQTQLETSGVPVDIAEADTLTLALDGAFRGPVGPAGEGGRYVNVQSMGAEGDGMSDDTAAITSAIEEANRQQRGVYFPGGDYYITGALPMYSDMAWVGDGMAYQQTHFLKILSIEPKGYGEAEVFVEDPEGRVTHRMMDGDPVKISGCAESGNNGIHSVDRVEPGNDMVRINNAAAVSESPANAEIRVAYPMGGSLIRFQNVGDGSLNTGDRFIEERGLRHLKMHDIGFVGPGINSVYGGGLRFKREESGRAITGYDFKNVSLEHVAMDGLRFDQLIHSTLSHLYIKRCVGDGLLFEGGPVAGGTTTSVHIEAPYIQNVKRGIASYTSAYCSVTNPVIEGTSIGYYFERAIGLTLDSPASETIKFDEVGAGCGETLRLIDCYGTTINSPTVYYNPQETAWAKCAIMAVDPQRRVESPFGAVSGGHIHWSVGSKIPAVATRWDGPTNEGRVYVDVSEDYGYRPPSGSTSSSWVGNSYWDDDIQIKGTGFERDERFNERYKVTSIEKVTYTSSDATEKDRPPGPHDDAEQGFAFGSGWKDTTLPTREGRWFCLDATEGAARWTDAEALFEIEFEGRDGSPLDKQAVSRSTDAYLIRAGRNYGADVATDIVYRVLETATNQSGDLLAWLDISEWLPVRYIAKVEYDPFTGYSRRGYAIQSQDLYTHSDGTTYLQTTYIVPSTVTDGHDWKDGLLDPQAEEGHPIHVTFDELGIEHEVQVDYVEQDESDTSLRTYVPVEEFFRAGEQLHIEQTMLSEMEGDWTVDAAVFDETTEGTPCVKVTCSDRTLRNEIARSVDYGLYTHPRTSAPLSTGMSVTGLDALFMYDPGDAVTMEGGRSFEVAFASGELEATARVPGASNFNFTPSISGSFTRVRHAGTGARTASFERDDDTEAETVQVRAVRKKSPGFEAIYDRNPATELRPEVTENAGSITLDW
jgi:hypothetical protein